MTAGTTNVDGTLDASAPNGGNGGAIETSAANVKVADGAKVTTAAANGLNGSWLLDPNDFTILPSGGDITGAALTAALSSNDVTIQTTSGTASCTGATCATGTSGSGNINVNDTVSWNAHTLTLNAYNNVDINAAMTVTGTGGLTMTTGASGNVNVGFLPSGLFAGVVSFSGTGALSMNGNTYTVINNATDLQAINSNPSGNYALGSSFSVSSGVSATTSNNFTGKFDGLGNTISGLSTTGTGLFSEIASGVVQNVAVSGTSSALNSQNGSIGMLASINEGTIRNSYTIGSVSADPSSNTVEIIGIGGLVGLNTGTIYNSHSSVTVAGSNATGFVGALGGLVGGNYGTIVNSYATGSVSGGSYVGGLAGTNSVHSLGQDPVSGTGASISNSYATGTISGGFAVGGLVGLNIGDAGTFPAAISNSYATGAVVGGNGSEGVGGLVGIMVATGNSTGHLSISNSFSTGSVSAGSGSTGVGGLVGCGTCAPGADIFGTVSGGGSVTSSFWDETTSGQSQSAFGTGKTTTQMQTPSTFPSASGWASSVWEINSGSYPLLIADMTPLTITAENVSQTYNGSVFPGSGYSVVYSVPGAGSSLSGTLSYGDSSQAATAAGSYSIVPSGLSVASPTQQSYYITYENGTLTINKLALTGTIATGSSTYGSSLSPGVVSFTNLVSGDSVTAASVLVNTTGLTSTGGMLIAGSHTGIESVGTSLSGSSAGNYTFAGATGDYVVGKLALTGSIATGSSTYGSSLTPGAVSFTNAVSGDVVTAASVSVNLAGSTSSSGNLTAGSHNGIESVGSSLTGADAGNYTFAGTTGNYVVSQLALAGSIAAGSSTYGASLAPGVASFTNAISGDILGTATVVVNTSGLTSSSGNLTAGSHGSVEAVSTLNGADAGNYSFAGVTGSYSVSQLALTGSIATGSSTYGSSLAPGAVSFTNALSGDTVTGGTVSVNIAGATSSSGNLIAGSHAGIESVGSTLGGADGGNYTFAGATGNYIVSKLALTGSIGTGSSTYGSSLTPGSASFSNLVSGDVLTPVTINVNTSGATSSSGHLIAATHTGVESISALTGADGNNYTFAGVTGDYVVSKLALAGTIVTGSSTYGASLAPGAASFSNAISGDVLGTATVSVNTTGATSGSGNLTAGSHAGVESLTALSGVDAGNYSFTAVSGNYDVNQLALVGNLASGSSTYGSSLAPGAASFTNVISGDTVSAATVSINTSGATSSSGNLTAGTHNGIETVSSITGADSGNYSFGGISGNYTVSKLALIGSITAGSSTYGATLAPGSVSFSNLVSGDVVTPGTATVSITGLTSASGHLVAGSHAGIESVSSLSGADAGNYTFTSVTGNYNVSQLALLGSIASGSSTYGSALAAGSVSFSNLVSGDAVTAGTVSVNITGATSSSGNLTAGTHTGIESVSSLTGADASNYSFAAISGNYTVGKLALAGSIAGGSSTYGSSLAPGAASFTNVVSGDVVSPSTVSVNTSGATSTSGNLTAGTHNGIETVSSITGVDSSNYSFSGISGNYTVSKLALTGSIAAGSSTYGATLAPGSVTFSNLVSGDVVTPGAATVSITALTSASGHLVAGSHAGIESVSSITGADAGNYTFTSVTGNYNVSQLALLGSIASGSSTYGSTLAAGSVSFSNLVSGDAVTAGTVSVNISGATSTSGNLTAGTHNGIESVSSLTGADASNYSFAAISGNYTVGKLALAGSIAGGSSTYGSSLAPGAASFSNVVSGDVVSPSTVSVNISGATSTSGNLTAGTHNGIETVSSITGVDSSNYSFSGISGNYTVSKLALTGSIAAGSSTYGATLAPGSVSFGNLVSGDVVTPGAVTVNSSGLTSASGHLVAGSHAGIETVSSITGADAGNYTFTSVTGDYNVSQLALVASIGTGSSTYGSTLAPGSISFTNLVSGDAVAVGSVSVNTSSLTSSSGHLIAGTHAGIESVSASLSGADSGNYTFTGATGNYVVGQFAIGGSIATGNSVYGATLSPGAVTLNNVISGDVVNTPVAVVNVGSAASTASTSGNLKAGSYNGIESAASLSGADAGNYTVSGLTGNYVVNKLTITATATGTNKIYDGNVNDATSLTAAGLVNGDLIVLSDASATFTDKNVGTGKVVTVSGISLTGADAGNYVLANDNTSTTATITPLAITVTATGVNKVYDGSTVAGVNLSGGLSGDAISFTDSSANFSNANAGNGKTISVTGISASGADAGNYTINNANTTTTANITPAQLTISGETAANKVYDGTTAATLTGGNLNGVVNGDVVTLVDNGSFASKNVGTGVAVTVADSLSGAAASNYTLVQPALSATITPATLTYNATSATASAGQNIGGLSGTVSGFVATDRLSNATTGNVVWTTPAGPASLPGQYAINGGGLAAQNYLFVQGAGNATALTINPAALSASLPRALDGILASLFSLNGISDMNLFGDGNGGPGNDQSSSGYRFLLGDMEGNGWNKAPLRVINGGVKLPDNVVYVK